MRVLDSGCSRHMCGKKENFKTIKKIDGGFVRFGDNVKGEVTRVGTITLSSSCDLVEVYLVEGLKHNLLSISQLCDAGFQVTFNTSSCIINHSEKKLTIVGDRSQVILGYGIENLDTQESEAGEDEIKSSKSAEDISKMSTENITEEPATAEVELTTPADKINVPREWRFWENQMRKSKLDPLSRNKLH
ncbi:uncharacterized protein LOC125877580 [Solanum stenotomum]|uniref:uncharacterized protein LOC125877580 n=1 Tax=Solanum stenotomum TaxID=172797 RepID=UPI0020D08842|nr:uncharacterized protein LOC125877580 [Solanum stenotomum]